MTSRSEGPFNPIHEWRGRTTTPRNPPPPYQNFMHNMLFMGARFDWDAARAAVPSELEISPEGTGIILTTNTDGGWGLEPYSLFFIGIDLAGADGPDDLPGYFRAVNRYSGMAGETFRKYYNNRIEPGTSRQWQEDGVWYSETTAGDTPTIRLALKPQDVETPDPYAGIMRYLADAPGGGISDFYVTYTAAMRPSDPLEFDILEGADDLMRSLAPKELLYASYSDVVPIGIGEPKMFDPGTSGLPKEAIRLSLMDLLSRIGHAAALVSREGRVLFANNGAKSILTNWQIGSRLLAWRQQDQRHLDDALIGASEGTLVTSPVPLVRPDDNLPVLAQVLPVSSALAGEPALLVLFRDPTADGSNATPMVLEALGLTPAEARLAAQVGAGQSVRESAELVGITENTARSTLKIVYDKLGIGKQSELAGIVARLG